MKSSLLNGILFASILTLTACGKDKKSGGGNPAGISTNLYNAGLTQTSQQILEKNKAWFNGAAEGPVITGERIVVKNQYSYNTTPECTNKTFLGIPYTSCIYTSGSNAGTELSRSTLYLFQDGRAINAKGNTELNAVFSGASGTLISAIDLSQSASRFEFLRTSDGTIVSYVIERSYHSLLNPVLKTETSQARKIDIVTKLL